MDLLSAQNTALFDRVQALEQQIGILHRDHDEHVAAEQAVRKHLAASDAARFQLQVMLHRIRTALAMLNVRLDDESLTPVLDPALSAAASRPVVSEVQPNCLC